MKDGTTPKILNYWNFRKLSTSVYLTDDDEDDQNKEVRDLERMDSKSVSLAVTELVIE